MKKRIMILGTSSSVGKSTIATGFCRYFKDKGYNVSPFKALNISLNSYVTEDGDEIGRSQVVQAEASKIKPKEYMNPILMKPAGGKTQVIVRGRVHCTMDAYKYKDLNAYLKEQAYEAFLEARENHEVLVLEGSGGCAELNLRKTDIANMYMAVKTNTPVILVADIEKGGVFAAVIGTLTILPEEEKKLIKGIIINKFRGKPEFFNEGVKIIEDLTGIKVLGVMPYTKLDIEEEDGTTDNIKNEKGEGIDIAVIRLPHMSNFTDLNYMSTLKGISVRYIENPSEIEKAEIIVIPGSKNTIDDLKFIKATGFKEALEKAKIEKKKIIGICGGFQILGETIKDPLGIEGEDREEEGLKMLSLETTFNKEKTTRQIKVKTTEGIEIEGYEIHNGESKALNEKEIWIKDKVGNLLGMKKDNIYGSYIHGIFDNTEIIKELLGNIEIKDSYEAYKEKQYDKLKDTLMQNIDMEYVEEVIMK